MIHDNYLINLAAEDPRIRALSIGAFRGEVERALAIGAEYLVAHPGSYGSQGWERGVCAVVESLREAVAGLATKGLTILIENTAGGGTKLGGCFEELKAMRELAAKFVDVEVGFCLDTCHLLASGYDVSTPEGVAPYRASGRRDPRPRDTCACSTPTIRKHRSARTSIATSISGKDTSASADSAPFSTHPKLKTKPFVLETPHDTDDRSAAQPGYAQKTMPEKTYDHKQIELKWFERWENDPDLYKAEENSTKPKYYLLEMLPYPSGTLHMGHVRNYTIGDALARYKWMRGFNVLHPMGWDSFGLPAENAALKRGLHPRDWTRANIAEMKKTHRRFAFAYDWDREISTCEPEYYHWNQWLFIKMYERGLAYRKHSRVNWCPECATVLANEQVVEGCCWRHETTPVEQRELEQWFFKITDYADELVDASATGFEGRWPERVHRDAAQLDRPLRRRRDRLSRSRAPARRSASSPRASILSTARRA